MNAPLLSLIVFSPLAGILALYLVPRGREAWLRGVALAASLVPLALALAMIARLDPGLVGADGRAALQFVEHVPWISSFAVEYFVGVDGLSATLVLLTALTSVVAIGASWSIPASDRLRGFLALFLLLETGMAGVFCAQDLFLFFVFWEVTLLPMYFLIGAWGGSRREYAAIKFFLYTFVGSVVMLLGIIALYLASPAGTLVDGTPAAHTFDMTRLAAADFSGAAPLGGLAFSRLVFIALFIGFAVKIPVVPLHTWLPDAHVEAPTSVSVVLAAVLLKMGVYGLGRIAFPILPDAAAWAAPALAWLGAVNIVYGALAAMAQTDLKRLVAYSSIGHMGFCLLGLAALTPTAVSGAYFQLASHGLITTLLFVLVGVLYDRTHVRGLGDFGGVAQVMPRYAAVFGFAFMASLGLPGLSGFIGEALVLLGSFRAFAGAVALAAVGLVVTAAYHLAAIQKIQLGPFNETWRDALARDLDRREALTLLPVAALVLALGVYPRPVLAWLAGPVADVIARVTGAGP